MYTIAILSQRSTYVPNVSSFLNALSDFAIWMDHDDIVIYMSRD